MSRKIEIILNKSEITAGTRGSSLGPDAIITAARKSGSLIFGNYPITTIPVMNHMLDQPVKFPFAKRIEGLIQIFDNISNAVQKSINEDRFPLILASDHGSAGGTIAGLKALHPNKKLGVIWIDAHGDLHTPYTTPSGNMHGMPLATAIGEDNLDFKRNDVKGEVAGFWQKLKDTGVKGQKIDPSHLVFIAVRDTEPEEEALMEKYNIKNHTVADLRKKGVQSIINETLTQLETCDMIYVSFDVDSMDPDLTSYGTGTPVKEGLTPEEGNDLLVGFAKEKRTACIEFVEVNPCLDNQKNRMAEITFELVTNVILELEK
jgi:arginase